MKEKRYGKYPNKHDFNPYVHLSFLDTKQYYELPLADPSETLPTESYQAREVNHPDLHRPSAFGANVRKLPL